MKTKRWLALLVSLSMALSLFPAGPVTARAADDNPSYNITIAAAEHGSVQADRETARQGETVALTVEPEDGYILDTLTVTCGETAVPVQDNTFRMPAGDVTVTAAFREMIEVYISSGSQMKDALANADRVILNCDTSVGENLKIPENRTVTLDLAGYNLLMVDLHSEPWFNVNGNLTLEGEGNIIGSDLYPVVVVHGGSFTMNGGTITHYDIIHKNQLSGRGVVVIYGTFTMTGGSIERNDVNGSGPGYWATVDNWDGGGVYLRDSSTFNMSGGSITGNSASDGGGVYLCSVSTFNLSGGSITGNSATCDGGGVYVGGGTFTMTDGSITGNSATCDGGGVYVREGKFTMTDGSITGNSAILGGGVYYLGTFNHSGGRIEQNEENDVTSGLPRTSPPQRVPLTASGVTLSTAKYTYNGKVKKPGVTVKADGKTLKKGTDYTVSYASGRKNAGTYKVTVTGTGSYTGEVTKKFTIGKAANPMKVKGKTASVKYSKVKKKKQTLKVGKVLTFTKKAQGTVTYQKAGGNKKITVAKKNGAVTVKKGLKKGRYQVKVKVKAGGSKNYKAATKTVSFTVRVK